VKIKEQKMKLEIGNKITWVSAAGKLHGEITNIVLSLNAANKVVPWIDIKSPGRSSTRLCATDGNLKMMKVAYDDPDMVERTNIMTGKKYMEKKGTPVFLSPACESYWSM
jgi:hypothetical protein